MRATLSVNEALDRLDELAGRDICIRGLFCFEFENISLWHVPKAERRDYFQSSIWLMTGSGALRFDKKTCEARSGKIVIVEGTLIKPDPFFGGGGHLSAWPAEFLTRTLEKA